MGSAPPHGQFVKVMCTKNDGTNVEFAAVLSEEESKYFKPGQEYAGTLKPARQDPAK
jgi:hypothetical protein